MSEVSTIIDRLLQIKDQQDILSSEVSALWKAFYKIADREAGEGIAYRYLDEEKGLVIARIIRKSENIDPEKLKEKVEELVGHQAWLDISIETRSLDPARLEVSMQKGTIQKEIVDGCMDRRSVASKFGPRKATKEELEELAEQEAR